MKEQAITALGPAIASYLRRFLRHLGQERMAQHFGTYCRGLVSDLPRKSIEPIALAAGTAVRTLQAFLVASSWEYRRPGTRSRSTCGRYGPISRAIRWARSE